MGDPLRTFATIAIVLVSGVGNVQAWGEPLSVTTGWATPLGGTKQWVGSAGGPSIDLMESFTLDSGDTVRMRLGYFAFRGWRDLPQTLALSGDTAAVYPATTSNQLFAFTYGADYIHPFPAKVYILGGAGVSYLQVSRSGTIDLTSNGFGPTLFRYNAESFVPYVCAGMGFPLNKYMAIEGRYQYSSLKGQTRGVDFSASGFQTPALATVNGISASALTLGLVFSF